MVIQISLFFYIFHYFFQKVYTNIPFRHMENLLPQFEPYKDKIPEFIIKLYHILQQKQYGDYLTWHGDSQILIKQPKKLQDKVLPHFFRHRNLHSFVRQLNMYRFSKVIKLVKLRNYMYFKNPHFKRGEVKELQKISRNTKKSRRQNMEAESFSDIQKQENLSIDNELRKNNDLTDYKKFVRLKVQEIAKTLKKLGDIHPFIKQDLSASLTKCNELLDIHLQQENNSFINLSESDLNLKAQNSEKFLSILDPPGLFPSQINF